MSSLTSHKFAKLTDCRTWELDWLTLEDHFFRLLDHGFAIDRACMIDPSLKGYEIAVVAHTYCNDHEIDNPPDGLRCVRLTRLQKQILVEGEPGTLIAVVVANSTAIAGKFISTLAELPSYLLPFAMPQNMVEQGYSIDINAKNGGYPPEIKVVKPDEHPLAKFVTLDLSLPTPMDEVVDNLKSAIRILDRCGRKGRFDRLDSVSWRVADASLLLRNTIISSGMKGVQGVHTPTGRGAMLAKKVAK